MSITPSQISLYFLNNYIYIYTLFYKCLFYINKKFCPKKIFKMIKILYLYIQNVRFFVYFNINKILHCKILDSTFFIHYKKFRFVIHYKSKCRATT